MEQLFIVWFSDGEGWFVSESMKKQDANVFADKLEQNGFRVRIHPRPQPQFKEKSLF